MMTDKILFSSIKGFYFYQYIIRKDFINKRMVINAVLVPEILNLNINYYYNTNTNVISPSQFFSLLCIFESITSSSVTVKKCILPVSNAIENYKISVNLQQFHLYEIFLQIFYLWFRGFIFPSKQYASKSGIEEEKKTQAELLFSSLKKKVSREIIYVKYIEPKFKTIKDTQKTVILDWCDFTFCSFISIHASYICSSIVIKFCLTFNTFSRLNKILLISALRLLHRLKKPSKKEKKL